MPKDKESSVTRLAVMWLSSQLREANEAKFEDWARQRYSEVPNPNKDGRKDTITFDTLLGYARKGDPAASDLIARMRYEFLRLKETEETPSESPDRSGQGQPDSPSSKFDRSPDLRAPNAEPKVSPPDTWGMPDQVRSRVQSYLDEYNDSDRWEALDKKMAKATTEAVSRERNPKEYLTPEAIELEKLRKAQPYLLEDFQETLSDDERKAWRSGLAGLSRRGQGLSFDPSPLKSRGGPSQGMDRDVREREVERFRSQQDELKQQKQNSEEMIRVLRSWGVPDAGGMLTGKPKREKPDEPSALESAMMKALAYTQAYMNHAGLDSVSVSPTRKRKKDNKEEVTETEGMPAMSLDLSDQHREHRELDAYHAFMGVLSPDPTYFPVPGGKSHFQGPQGKPKGWKDRFRSLLKSADQELQSLTSEKVASLWLTDVRTKAHSLEKSRLSQRAAQNWSKQAISPKYILQLQQQMKDKELSFDHLFGDKKRLVVPLPDLNKSEEHDSHGQLKHLLSGYFKEIGPEDTVDWVTGEITTQKGQKKRVGKAIAKAQKSFIKEHPETWEAIKASIRATRALGKKRELFSTFVVSPLEDTFNKFLEEEVYYMDSPLKNMYVFAKDIRGEDPNLKDYYEDRPQNLDLSGPREQAQWLENMRAILSLSDEERSKGRVYLDGLSRQISELRDKQSSLISQSTDVERGRSEIRSIQKQIDSLAAKLMRGREAQRIYEAWPFSVRETLLDNIERALPGLMSAAKAEAEAGEQLRSLRENLSPENLKRSYAVENLEQARQEYDLWRARVGEDRSLVISRAPVDVLRMSDHPTAPQVIESCHSEGKSKFECAQEEAQGLGLVGYVVPTSELANIDLDSDEIFTDIQRGVEGIVPSARIRFRRYESKKDGSELAIPELKVYGIQYDNLVALATQWAREAQPKQFANPPEPDEMGNYVLTGGSYRDNTDGDLFSNFFGDDSLEGEKVQHSSTRLPRHPQFNFPHEKGLLRIERWEPVQSARGIPGIHVTQASLFSNESSAEGMKAVGPQPLSEEELRDLIYNSSREWYGAFKEQALATLQGEGKQHSEKEWLDNLAQQQRAKLESEEDPFADSDDSQFWEWLEKTHPKVPNPNPEGRLDKITPATLKSYSESEGPYREKAQAALSQYRKQFEQQLQRIASGWLKQAISTRHIVQLQKQMENGDLSFGHLFGDKKRLIVPIMDVDDPKLRALVTRIHGNLLALKAVNPEDKVDWNRGLVVSKAGKEVKLGKVIARAQAAFIKQHPEAWKAIKDAIRSSRAHARQKELFERFVVTPLRNQRAALLRESDPDASRRVFGFRDLFALKSALSGDPLRLSQKDLDLLDMDPQRIPDLLPEDQGRWGILMGQALEIYQKEIQGHGRDEVDSKLSGLLDSSEEQIKEEFQVYRNLWNRVRPWGARERKDNRHTRKLRHVLEAFGEGEPAIDFSSGKSVHDYESPEYRDEEIRQFREVSQSLSSKVSEHLALERIPPWVSVVGGTEVKETLQSIQRALPQLIDSTDKVHQARRQFDEDRAKRSPRDQEVFHVLANLERDRQDYDLRKGSGESGMSLVISRAPIDVLRMSDHPTAPQKIESCHSEGKSYFHCAVAEAQGLGFVGYVVSNSDLDKVDLEADEIFTDRDRKVSGIVPYARIRFRRYENKEDNTELAVPELRVYGASALHDKVVYAATQWAREAQKEYLENPPDMRDYVLTGGSYRDSEDISLWKNLFGSQDSWPTGVANVEHRDEKLTKGLFWKWLEETYPQVPNPNPEGNQDRITPTTLKSYSESKGPYQQTALQMLSQYRKQFDQQRGRNDER